MIVLLVPVAFRMLPIQQSTHWTNTDILEDCALFRVSHTLFTCTSHCFGVHCRSLQEAAATLDLDAMKSASTLQRRSRPEDAERRKPAPQTVRNEIRACIWKYRKPLQSPEKALEFSPQTRVKAKPRLWLRTIPSLGAWRSR